MRHALDMTQEEFARALGVTLGTYNRWENGHHRPQRVWREKLAALEQQVPASRKALS